MHSEKQHVLKYTYLIYDLAFQTNELELHKKMNGYISPSFTSYHSSQKAFFPNEREGKKCF